MWRGALALLSTSWVTGCAVTYVDHGGVAHIVGLVDVTVPRDADNRASATVIRVTNVGLSIVRADTASGISVGYNATAVASVAADSCAVIPNSFVASVAQQLPRESTHENQ